MRFIFFSLLFVFSSSAFSATQYHLININTGHPDGTKVLARCGGTMNFEAKYRAYDCVKANISSDYQGSLTWFPRGSDNLNFGKDTANIATLAIRPELNYCDTPQYETDRKKAEKVCLESANGNQDVNFTASCDRITQKLVKSCVISDRPIPPPPEPDGTDLTAVIDTIKSNTSQIVLSNDGLLSPLGDILAANRSSLDNDSILINKSAEQLIALDKSSDLLLDIKNLTSSLNESNATINTSIGDVDNLINDNADINAANIVNAVGDSISELAKQTDVLKNQSFKQDKEIELSEKLNNNLSSLSADFGVFSGLFNKKPVDFGQSDLFDTAISVESMDKAVSDFVSTKKEYQTLINNFKDSVIIKTNFDSGVLTESSINIQLSNGQGMSFNSSAERFVSIADIIKPIFLMLCSLIAVAIVFGNK